MPDRSWLEAYVNAWDRQDVDAVKAFYHDDLSYTDMVLHETFDRSTIEAFLKRTFGRWESLTFEIVSACFAKDAVTWEWRMRGEGGPDEATHDAPGMSMMEIKDGKILRNTDYWSRLKAPPR